MELALRIAHGIWHIFTDLVLVVLALDVLGRMERRAERRAQRRMERLIKEEGDLYGTGSV